MKTRVCLIYFLHGCSYIPVLTFHMVDSGFSVIGENLQAFGNSSILRHIKAYSGVNGHIQECFWYFHKPL